MIRIKQNYWHRLAMWRDRIAYLVLIIGGAGLAGALLHREAIWGGLAWTGMAVMAVSWPFDYVLDERGIGMEPRSFSRSSKNRERIANWDDVISYEKTGCHGCNGLYFHLTEERFLILCTKFREDEGIGADALKFLGRKLGPMRVGNLIAEDTPTA